MLADLVGDLRHHVLDRGLGAVEQLLAERLDDLADPLPLLGRGEVRVVQRRGHLGRRLLDLEQARRDELGERHLEAHPGELELALGADQLLDRADRLVVQGDAVLVRQLQLLVEALRARVEQRQQGLRLAAEHLLGERGLLRAVLHVLERVGDLVDDAGGVALAQCPLGDSEVLEHLLLLLAALGRGLHVLRERDEAHVQGLGLDAAYLRHGHPARRLLGRHARDTRHRGGALGEVLGEFDGLLALRDRHVGASDRRRA
ncbi:MAG: hypothetical protein M3340_05985, partial [Actinomycetota bacterium]|nr:hypothetical protein [Actinomycetota bacterium]